MIVRAALLFGISLAAACAGDPIEEVPTTETLRTEGLDGPVDVVRDEWGIPHVYARTAGDAAFGQGYAIARDRLLQLDLARRLAQGTLAELGGDLSASLIDSDIRMRVHHLRRTSEEVLAQLSASTLARDRAIVTVLRRFAAGVNAWLEQLQAGDALLDPAFAFAYDPSTTPPWTPVDSIAVGRLLAFQQAYTAEGDLYRSALDAAGAAKGRTALARDLQLLDPVDPTFTRDGWNGLDGATTQARREWRASLPLLLADRSTVLGVGLDRMTAPDRGSNNWIVGPARSASGHTLVANDPHLDLGNPSTLYLVHLTARGGDLPLDVFGAAIPGVPGVGVGMNRHVAWGATDSYLDATDVYEETVVRCGGGVPPDPCVIFRGAKVPLTARLEEIVVGRYGHPVGKKQIVLWDVPHHGPILPRVTADHDVEVLGSRELSVRFTGYEPTLEVRALIGLDGAASMAEAVAALDADYKQGGFNWVIGDDRGHFGWTESIRVPRRPAGTVPWKVLPGDGSAEWNGELDLRYVPHAFDPDAGFIATANNDPIGVTRTGDPLEGAPVVDGAPLYLGADFDPGTRVGRITNRLTGTQALTLDDLESIQADAVTTWGRLLQPTAVAAARAALEELAQPGSHPELASRLAAADPAVIALLGTSVDALTAWSFDTPSATDEEQPSPTQVADSRATVIFNHWMPRFVRRALGDDQRALGVGLYDASLSKLILRMCTEPGRLATGQTASGESRLFDDLETPEVETKLQIALDAWLDALAALRRRLGEPAGWRWGRVHTLALEPVLPIDALRVPLKTDPLYGAGFPRHGDNGTVDLGDHGLGPDAFGYRHGPAIRFVCELDPAGPVARITLPGGEAFDPHSPHYRDLFELWRANRTAAVPFAERDVAASARRELDAHALGRLRIVNR